MSREELEQKFFELTHKYNEAKETISLLRQRFYGRSSEKRKREDDQTPYLFAQDAPQALKEQREAEVKTITVKSHTRKRGGRKPFPKNLPREEVIVDLDSEERKCPCCGEEMAVVSVDVSERAEMIPPKMLVKKTLRYRRSCRKCNSKPVAKPSPYVLPHSSIGNGLFAYMVVSKFNESLPLNRIEKVFARFGLEYSQKNMSNNIMSFMELYGAKIFMLLEKKLLSGPLIHVDETSLQVHREAGRKDTQKSYLWAFVGARSKVVLFHYRPSRSAEFLLDLLSSYRGAVLTDGYVSYDRVLAQLKVTHAACHAHARRHFVEADKLLQSKETKYALKLYSKLYKIEAKAREENITGDALVALRQEESKPLIRELYEFSHKVGLSLSHRSKFGSAVSYFCTQRPKLSHYLANPHIPMDNNPVENAIRPFVVGRKNWLFSGGPKAAKASCLFFSLVETAKRNGHEPYWVCCICLSVYRMSNPSKI